MKATTPRLNKWIPWTPTPKQAAFLLLNHIDEVLFGGAAGGAKSTALLMGAAQFVDEPGYSAILFRRTYPQLFGEGGLIPKSHEWWSNTKAHWSGEHKTWTFPSGAKVAFGHLQREVTKHKYQGHEFQFIGFDELTHFTESQYAFLGSRLRKAKGINAPLRRRSTANPGGDGHKWVKETFVNNPVPGERLFLPSFLADNPHLDPAYRAQLMKLPTAERERLLYGNWNAVEAGPLWADENFGVYDGSPREFIAKHRRPFIFTVWDCKGKLYTSAKVKAGESLVSGMCFAHIGASLYLLGAVYGAWGLRDTVDQARAMAKRWPTASHVVENKALGPELIKRLRRGDPSKGIAPISGVIAWEPSGSKIVRMERCQPYVLGANIWTPSRYAHPFVEDVRAEWVRAPAPPNDKTDTLVMAIEYRLAKHTPSHVVKEIPAPPPLSYSPDNW